MCNTNPSAVLIPYGLKVPNPTPYMPFGTNVSQMALDLQRAQFYDYSTRLQYGLRAGYPNSLGLTPYHAHPGTDPYMHPYLYKDPRARYIHEEPKPNHSYIGLIAMGILSHRDNKLVLSDIYQWILDNYAYFRTRGPGWRNSIRHNLSLNDCFIKSGRSANGKGHYWAIHPANLEDFKKGDFRRRRAQRRVRKHMGLSVPDDEESPTPSPTSTSITWDENDPITETEDKRELDETSDKPDTGMHDPATINSMNMMVVENTINNHQQTRSKKRLFDVESLLAPDNFDTKRHCLNESRFRTVDRKLAIEEDVTVDVGTDNVQNTDIENEQSPKDLSLTNTENSDGNTDKENVVARVSGTIVPVSGEMYGDVTPGGEKDIIRQTGMLFSSVGSDSVWKHGCKNFSLMASRPSAFHNARMCSWGSLSPYLATYPLVSMKGHYPLVIPRSSVSMDTAQKWQETVAQLATSNQEEKPLSSDE
ncbi:forkhead box protein J3-like [Mizuhopecten yessoensis]|uniref:Forkhead box protein B1 n=1 Tax=Mizuhopecten yessoensis TaxID=6573 RepID=A0A210PEJ0_MIZYE|nr:forkhead box protein J3-like [Mizuhopecten yessoensis]OWF34887.1 Forkhead box protein B1 [Mizuhopecten yessoensis]